MDYATLVITVLYIISLGLTEYITRTELKPETKQWIQLYITFMAGLRGITIHNGKSKLVYRNKASGLFMKEEDARLVINTTTRIVQAVITALAGGGAGLMYI